MTPAARTSRARARAAALLALVLALGPASTPAQEPPPANAPAGRAAPAARAMPAADRPPSGAAAAAFDDAVAAYRAGDYASAQALWIEALRLDGADPAGGLDRAAALYDLGNAAFRRKRPVEAAGWYSACLRVDPRHGPARANLEFVRSEAGLDPADRGDLTSTLERLVDALSVAESFRLLLGAWVLFAAALAFEALRGGALARRLVLASTALLALALVPWIHHQRQIGADPVFVVSPDGASLRSEPREEGATIGRLDPAERAQRVDELPGWTRVERGDRSSGWVRSDSVLALRGPFALPQG